MCVTLLVALSDKLDVPMIASSLLSAKISTTNTLPRMPNNTTTSLKNQLNQRQGVPRREIGPKHINRLG